MSHEIDIESSRKKTWKICEGQAEIHKGKYEQIQAIGGPKMCVFKIKKKLEIKNITLDIKHPIDGVNSRPDKDEK